MYTVHVYTYPSLHVQLVGVTGDASLGVVPSDHHSTTAVHTRECEVHTGRGAVALSKSPEIVVGEKY